MLGDLDDAVDRAVRDMLEAEPPAGFRGRVLDRLGRPARRFTWPRVAVPLGAMAIVMLGIFVFVGRRDAGIVAPFPADHPLPATMPGEVAQHRPPSPVTPSAPPRARKTTIARGMIPAPSVTEPLPRDDAHALPPLGGPSPMALKTIEHGTAPTLSEIDVRPIAVQPLEVNALSDTPPRERHEE